MDALLLLLLDSRSPAGAHNHSAGMEPAVTTGLVRDLDDVTRFCRRRLLTSGRVAAHFAAAACALWPDDDPRPWADLDAEFDARTPAEANRAASRALARGLLRLVRATLPTFRTPWADDPVHHAVLLGAAVAAAGGDATDAARAAALGAVSVPASAAVRLLGLDPFGVAAMLAELAREIDTDPGLVPTGALAADAALDLDLLADFHLTTEVRLFAS